MRFVYFYGSFIFEISNHWQLRFLSYRMGGLTLDGRVKPKVIFPINIFEVWDIEIIFFWYRFPQSSSRRGGGG